MLVAPYGANRRPKKPESPRARIVINAYRVRGFMPSF